MLLSVCVVAQKYNSNSKHDREREREKAEGKSGTVFNDLWREREDKREIFTLLEDFIM